jgi:hypothetical protein
MYAATMGNSLVAIRLLHSGASPPLEDNLLKRDFLGYASVRSQWTTIVDVLGHIQDIPEISEDVARSWLTLGAILWVNDQGCNRDLKHFQALLERGADPNII